VDLAALARRGRTSVGSDDRHLDPLHGSADGPGPELNVPRRHHRYPPASVEPYRSWLTSPRLSTARRRKVPGSAEPLTRTIRSERTSRRRLVSSGDRGPPEHHRDEGAGRGPWRCINTRVPSGSNASGSTSVAPRSVVSVTLRRPKGVEQGDRADDHVVASERNPPSMPERPFKPRPDPSRAALLGRPVVPEIWITMRATPRRRATGPSGPILCTPRRTSTNSRPFRSRSATSLPGPTPDPPGLGPPDRIADPDLATSPRRAGRSPLAWDPRPRPGCG
jgi:hypothetical protein